MKLSLAWIFDHIRGSWQTLDIDQFVRSFTSTITELDFHTKVTFNLDNLFIGRVTKINGQVFVFIPELNNECVLPKRDDVVVGGSYLIRNEKKKYHFATMLDFGSEKDLPMPALSIHESFLNGSWRELCEREDIILTLDNKSVTNRPDLWGHRGFAREVAAMLDLEMIPEDRLIIATIIKNYHDTTPKTDHNPLSLSILSVGLNED